MHLRLAIAVGLAATASIASAQTDGIFTNGFDAEWSSGTSNVLITASGGSQLMGRLYIPDLGDRTGAMVVAMHGCRGMWSNSAPWTVAQAAIEKWGQQLARDGYFVLAVDSYTTRTPAGVTAEAFQTQCTGTAYEGAVNPYVLRPRDFLDAMAWLRYRLGAQVSGPVGALGWSQGAETILILSSETFRDSNQTQYAATDEAPFAAAVAFYPGCGPLLGYLPNGGSGVTNSYWRPHVDLRINHAGEDPLEGNCWQRAQIAQEQYGSTVDSGHWVDYVRYEGAHHSFDGATSAWGIECDPSDADACAAVMADNDSHQFLSARTRP